MNEQIHDQAYLAALDASRTELGELLANLEQLQIRRERIENAIEALKPLVESGEQLVARTQETTASPEPHYEPSDPHYFLIQHPAECVPVSSEQAQDEPLDTIQRRIKSALGMAAVA